VLYVLDEPTIGLHPRDNRRLLQALLHLRDLGNTLVLVEHDREVIASADYLLDFGPGAGARGGEITARGTPKQVARLVRVEGAEHLHAALAAGHGAILLSAHFTSLEMTGRALVTVAPAGFLYRPTKNEVIALALKHFRTQYGAKPIPKDDIRAFVSALKRNECVWYAPDQSYRKKGAAMVPLFGIPAATNTFTPRLARMTGAPVLPYFLKRLPGSQGYLATIHPPLKNFPSDSPVSDTERFNRMIEAQVRITPEQYLWIHRRFKGLTDDYPDYYGPR